MQSPSSPMSPTSPSSTSSSSAFINSFNVNTTLAHVDTQPPSPSSSSSAASQPNVSQLSLPSLVLPLQTDAVPFFAVDIGGSLIKVVYFVRDESRAGGRIVFRMFETRTIDRFLDFIVENDLHTYSRGIKGTGGGAYKYADLLQQRLGLQLEHKDELTCLVKGSNFLLKNIELESFYFDDNSRHFVSVSPNVFPYLLVNVGSGVSIMRVDSETEFRRISGTSLGGGTFWGLCRLLTGCETFDEALELTRKGDHRNVDMLVGDIYGSDYRAANLSSNTIASSFGKVSYLTPEQVNDMRDGTNEHSAADLAQALLFTICNNLGQIGYLNAMREGLHKIYFGGFFIRDHPIAMQAISYAIRYWSAGRMQAFFFKHEGFLGALGAFLDEQSVSNTDGNAPQEGQSQGQH